MSMTDQLPCHQASSGETETIDRIIQTEFEQLQKDNARGTGSPDGLFKETAELLLHHPVLMLDALLGA